MRTIHLYTSVDNPRRLNIACFVHQAEIPPFNIWPEVVTWGERVFLFDHEQSREGYYREAFAVAAVTKPLNLGSGRR